MKSLTIFILLLCVTIAAHAQIENVPLDHDVYLFLKAMSVKGILPSISDDNPNLARFEVERYLRKIEQRSSELHTTEMKLLRKFLLEFSPELRDSTTTMVLFDGNWSVSDKLSESVSQKEKYLFLYEDENSNVFFEGIGHFTYAHQLNHGEGHARLYDLGFRMRGTMFHHLAYVLSDVKGDASGSGRIALETEPRLRYNYKFVASPEPVGNYEFGEGYLKYAAEPAPRMQLALQLGREQINFGLGYGSKLVLGDDHPVMDFLKFTFTYGVVHFSSVHASTVGEYHSDENLNFTKYLALNRIKVSFDRLFDFGFGDGIVYSRALDLAYLFPFNYYKFTEHTLQDRDNATFFIDLQTHFLPQLEFQGTYFIDEDPFTYWADQSRYSNKTGYQVGAYWYDAFTIPNLSFILEYTRIRPYVYSHGNDRSSYTAFGVGLGHHIGPNADEILARLNYVVNERMRCSLDARYSRAGKNILDGNGQVIRNVGGDMFQPFRDGIDAVEAPFLDGLRVNTSEITVACRVEPIRSFYIDICYRYRNDDHATEGFIEDRALGTISLSLLY